MSFDQPNIRLRLREIKILSFAIWEQLGNKQQKIFTVTIFNLTYLRISEFPQSQFVLINNHFLLLELISVVAPASLFENTPKKSVIGPAVVFIQLVLFVEHSPDSPHNLIHGL